MILIFCFYFILKRKFLSSAAFPAPRSSIASSELSFNIASGTTSTPRAKTDSPKEKPKNVMMANFFADATKPPASDPRTETTNPPINPPAPLPVTETKMPSFVPQPEPTPTDFAAPVEIKIPKPRIEKAESQAKIEVKLPERKEIPKEPVSQGKPSIDESLCLRAYREEQANFEKELKTRLEPLTWECGTDAEREQLVMKTALIDEFLRDLQDTTTSLSSDIAYLKALLLQSFAWLEETKSKNSESVKLSTRNRREGSKLAELERFFYYTQSQLVQASKVLDLQWSEQQSKEQNKMKIPNMEFIYQSLMCHGQILAKEKSNLENLTKKWKTLARGGTVSGLNRSLSNLHITVNSNFENDSAIDFRCKAIATKSISFSREKQIKLRDLLSEFAPRTIKAAKPTLIQDRLEATLSSLASLSPGKILQPKVEQKLSQKPKVQSPLASLNNIVSKIGSSGKEPEANLQKITSTFTAKSPALNMSTIIFQKPKIQQSQQIHQIQQNQQSSQASSLAKPFSKLDSISFGQKAEEKNLQKELTKTEKETSLFSNSISGTTQGINIGNISTPPVSSTFSIQSSVSLPSSTAAQSFSFTSKPAANLPTFSFASKPEDKTNLDLGGLNPNLQSSGLSISLVPEAKSVSSPQVTPAMSSINFGKASAASTPSAVFGQTSSATNAFGTPSTNAFQTAGTTQNSNAFETTRSIFGKSESQGNIFGTSQGSIFGGSSNFGSISSTGVVAGISASNGIFTSSSVPLSSPNVLSPAPISSSVIVSKPASVSIPTSPLTSTPVSSPISPPTLAPVLLSVSSPSVPISSPPPAYGSTIPPISSPSTTSGPDILNLSLGSSKPSSATSTTSTTSTLASSIFSTPVFGTSKAGSPVSTLNFGTASVLSSIASNSPVFGKEPTSISSSIFGGGSTTSTTIGNNAFGGSTTNPAVNPFGRNNLAQSPSSTSIFGNATSSAGSIFGGGTTAASVAFGMKTPPATGSIFGKPSQNSVFGASAGASVFGGSPVKPQETTFSMFGGSTLGGTTTSAFGQAPAFGGKPAFGASPDFGQAKPVFGSGFGGPAVFGSSTASAGMQLDSTKKFK